MIHALIFGALGTALAGLWWAAEAHQPGRVALRDLAAAPARAARWWAASATWRWQRHRDFVNGVDLDRFWTGDIHAIRPDRRIRTRAHHRLAGGGH